MSDISKDLDKGKQIIDTLKRSGIINTNVTLEGLLGASRAVMEAAKTEGPSTEGSTEAHAFAWERYVAVCK